MSSPPPPPPPSLPPGFLVALILILVSSWLNFSLYTAELLLCIRYFARPSRPLSHKIAVGILIFADTVCTVALCFETAFFILPPVITTNLRLILAPLAVAIICTYISAAIAQLFLCNLFYVLTGNILVTIGLVVLILVHLAFSWASGISVVVLLKVTGIVFTETTVGAISCAATDVIISVSLAWKFSRMMAGTRPENSTRSLLRRLLVITVSSGLFCAANTFVMMILLLKGNPVYNFFFTCQGRVYALTILGNFLVGIPERERNDTVSSHRYGTSGWTGPVVFHIDDSLTVDNRRSRGENSRTATTDHELGESLNVELDDLDSASASIHGKPRLHLEQD
ncbi:hypothetical protein C8F04DRAFT_1294952 [Mycena alexandri]|uniref:DUF6534 domain-containing protein n=1 Tax=Mycena alexandri TaxID=1745969 RepID=A0AAD6WWC7_9AGAR|nr:hypothetical protein C8F04DRAFT_1294952 [Mycena alexandri]